MKIDLHHKDSGKVIFSFECDDNSLSETINQAIKAKVSLKGLSLSDEHIYGIEFNDFHIDEWLFVNCDIEKCSFNYSEFTSVNFRDCRFIYCDFLGCNDTDMTISSCHIDNCKIHKSQSNKLMMMDCTVGKLVVDKSKNNGLYVYNSKFKSCEQANNKLSFSVIKRTNLNGFGVLNSIASNTPERRKA